MEYSRTLEALHTASFRGYVLLALIGLASITGATAVPPGALSETIRAVGAALITLGLSLPIVLFEQGKQNEQSFRILDTCKRAGISDVFASRKEDRAMLAEALDAAARRESTEMYLLGIAFPDLLAPGNLRERHFGQKVYSPSIELRALLLDPQCDAARMREDIERARGTTDDIGKALSIFLPGIVCERLGSLADQGKLPDLSDPVKVRDAVRISVGVYARDPIVFLIGFSDCVFAEQYHSGRPARWPHGECIGQHVPVIQYDQNAAAFRHLSEHFEYVWRSAEDKTLEVVQKAIEAYPDFIGQPRRGNVRAKRAAD
jgi:hypothetical protein